jgi:hypothetical protein
MEFAIIIFFLILLCQRKKKDFKVSYEKQCFDWENEQKKIAQDFDDKHLLIDAKREALDMFQQWLAGNLIIIRKPIIKFSMCHYPYTSKYTSEDLDTIRKEEFTRLKNEYQNTYGTNRNGCVQHDGKWKR